jgi:hypothetical protein
MKLFALFIALLIIIQLLAQVRAVDSLSVESSTYAANTSAEMNVDGSHFGVYNVQATDDFVGSKNTGTFGQMSVIVVVIFAIVILK